MIAVLINKIKSTTISKLIGVHSIVATISLLYLYIIISHFFPFAMYTKHYKLFLLIVLFIVIYFSLFFVYWHSFHNKFDKLQKFWKHVLVAFTLSIIVFSFTNAYKPLFPAESKITISTYDELGFMHINRENINGYMNLGSVTAFEILGEWNRKNGILVHQGSNLGQIIYEEVDFVSKGLKYHLIFVPQSSDALIQIEVEGQIDQVQIPDSDNYKDLFIYTINAPAIKSTSSFWETWVALFPLLRWISLFIFYLGASILIYNERLGRFEKVLTYSLLIILSFLLYNALLFQNEFINFRTYNLFWLFTLIIFFVFIPIITLLFLQHNPKFKLSVFLVILFLAIGLRLYWIFMVPSGQVSDFGLFHNWALQIAAGEPGITLTKHANFTRILSLFYRISPSDQIFTSLNVLFSLMTMFSVWMIGKTIDNEEMGLLAAYLYAIFPSQIGMVSIVCSDIFATSFLSLAVLLILLFVKRHRWPYLIAAALIFGMTAAIRAPVLIFSPVFLIIFYPLFIKDSLGRTFITKMLLIVFGFSVGFLLIKGIVSTVKVDGMLINEDKNVIGPLLMGTNIESMGRHNLNDEERMQNWESDEITQNGLKMVLARLTQHPLEFMKMLKHKYAYMFGNATYIADIAFLGEDMNYNTFTTNWPYDTYEIRNAVGMIGQYSFVLISIVAFGICYVPRKLIHGEVVLINLLIIFSALLAYSFFEVQPRYFRPVIPYILIFASMSLQSNFEMITKFITKFLRSN